MKKVFLLTAITFIAGALYFFSSSETEKITNETSSQDKEILIPSTAIEAQAQTIKVLKNSAKVNNETNYFFELVQDFSTDANSLFSQAKKNKDYKKRASQLFSNTLECYRDNFCGVDSEAEYFDPEQTPAQKTIKRMLEIYPPEENIFAQEDLLELLKNSNPQIPGLALKHLLESDENVNLSDVLVALEATEAVARASTLNDLFKRLEGESQRQVVIDEVARGAKELPPYSTVSFLEEAQNNKWSRDEAFALANSVCPQKYVDNNEHNWKAISFLINKILSPYDEKIESLCP
jgi:hypothetical protein